MREPIVYLKIVLNFVLLVGLILFVFLVVPKLLTLFLPFVIGWIVSVIAYPLVRTLEKKVKILPKHSSAIIIILVVGGVVGIMYLTIAIIIKEAVVLIEDLPELTQEFGVQFDEVSENIKSLSKSLPADLQIMVDNIITKMGTSLSDFTEDVSFSVSQAGTFAKNIADIFLIVIITILSAYFFIAERENISDKVIKSMPESVLSGWKLVSDNFKVAVGGYFKAQFKIMLLITLVMFVGFEILRVDYSFLLALGIAFLDFLPVFGTGAVLWPWAIICMLTGEYIVAIGLIVIYLICQILKQVLQPKMVGDSIGMNPLATLIFMHVGYQVYGVLGMIFGIPLGMILINLYRLGAFNRLIKGFKIIVQDINEFRKF